MSGDQSEGQEPRYPYFDEATSDRVVNARMGDEISPRLRHVMAVLVKHLHAAVKEIEPTHEEWLAAVQFLTDTGHMCTQWRQEFILLSDVLGVSMLVDSINNRRPSGATPNTIVRPPKFDYTMTTLPNGLQAVFLEDHSTPIVHLALWYHVGSKNEKAGRTGFAHLFEHLML